MHKIWYTDAIKDADFKFTNEFFKIKACTKFDYAIQEVPEKKHF